MIYFSLLGNLIRRPAWHGQLQQSGHFANCLAIADKLPSLIVDNRWEQIALCVAENFAVLDDLGEKHLLLEAFRAYRTLPLILAAWRYIFRVGVGFFEGMTEENWKLIGSRGYQTSLPLLVAYAKRHRERWDNTEKTRKFIELVGRVCDKLVEETHRNEDVHDPSFGHGGIPELGKQIRAILGDSRSNGA